MHNHVVGALMEKLSRKQKKLLTRIIIAAVAFLVVLVIDKTVVLSSVISGKSGLLLPFALYFAIYIFIGYNILIKSFKNIIHGELLDENFLMTVSTIGAFCLAIFRGMRGLEVEGFDEACAVLIFYQIGEFFQSYATRKSRNSIAQLMDIRPDYAVIMRNGERVKVTPEEVSVGETIYVSPGEKIPIDGKVIQGTSEINTLSLTGESMPQGVSEGSEVLSGSINLTSELRIETTKLFEHSTVSKILELTQNAAAQKSKAENFITKFSRVYTPVVCALALLLAVVPSIIFGDFATWLYRALSFLVVSCPCALVISIPLSFFISIGTCSRNGILVKGSNYIEKMNSTTTFVFDKTGTLTKGNFKITKILPEEKRDEILMLAAICERRSSHPIAKAILSDYNGGFDEDFTITDEAGKGIIASNGKDTVLCGNEKLMIENNISFETSNFWSTTVYVAKNGIFVGEIQISDEIKPESKRVLELLQKRGCKTIMLTGDNDAVAKAVSEQLGLSGYKSGLLPTDKVGELSQIMKNKSGKDVVCYVGDGINDAPVLAGVDIGISMGNIGSDAAIEASDVVLMEDNLEGIIDFGKIAKRTMANVFENIIFSISVKVLILILTALGITNMWLAVFGDVGVAVIAILNSMRLWKNRK